MQDALEMIVHSHGQRFLGDFLPNHILIEHAADLLRFRNPNVGRLPSRVLIQFFVENAFADVDTTVADINARAGDQLAHLGVALATERAHGEVGRARHICP